MRSILLIILVGFVSIFTFAYDQSKIIGENDLIPVNADGSNIPFKYKDLIEAFGLLSMSCTATHIGNGYVLTAAHCFWVGSEPVRNMPCSETTIQWGVRPGVLPYLKSTCEEIVFAQRDNDNDFAILKVSPIPDFYVALELVRPAVPTDRITLFSHPEELPLRWSGTCVVESQLDKMLSPLTLQHKCDTSPGSSGAVILDANTKKIVGIHNGGRSSTPGAGMNYGTFVMNEALLAELIKLGFN